MVVDYYRGDYGTNFQLYFVFLRERFVGPVEVIINFKNRIGFYMHLFSTLSLIFGNYNGVEKRHSHIYIPCVHV